MLHGRKCVSRLAAGGVVEASPAATVERPASYLRQLAVFQTSRSLALLARNVHNQLPVQQRSLYDSAST
uniref:Uncharacterized protein n=3 Tax=Oryza TaxID=4527 RepID=Q6AT82_ORYSJ|nr:unknown protein [Oryza sativa Japonica Group]AAV32136.1 unknown protein [Oryza sativa Japonica Group]